MLLKWLMLPTKTPIIDNSYISFLTPIEFQSSFNIAKEGGGPQVAKLFPYDK